MKELVQILAMCDGDRVLVTNATAHVEAAGMKAGGSCGFHDFTIAPLQVPYPSSRVLFQSARRFTT